MLATLAREPVEQSGWIYEEKYDGIRLLAYKEGERVTLRTRAGHDRTATYPEIAASVGACGSHTLVLDGEVVALDADLVSRFSLLQRSATPRLFATFDCLWIDGRDLRQAPLGVRRTELEQAIAGAERLFAARRLGTSAAGALRLARERGLEGVVAKRAAAPYRAGRSSAWRKLKIRREDAFVVGGYTQPAGSRAHFGALVLGAYRGRALCHVGRVGTGFSDRTLAALARRLRLLVQDESPFTPAPPEAGLTWVAPRLVAQVAFQEWTPDALLRAPVFLGLRDDVMPRSCRLPIRRAGGAARAARRPRTPRR